MKKLTMKQKVIEKIINGKRNNKGGRCIPSKTIENANFLSGTRRLRELREEYEFCTNSFNAYIYNHSEKNYTFSKSFITWLKSIK